MQFVQYTGVCHGFWAPSDNGGYYFETPSDGGSHEITCHIAPYVTIVRPIFPRIPELPFKIILQVLSNKLFCCPCQQN